MLDRAVALDRGIGATLQILDLFLRQCGHVLDQLDVHVREAVVVLVVVAGDTDELLVIIAQAGCQARV